MNDKHTQQAYYAIVNTVVTHMRNNVLPWSAIRNLTTAAIDDLFNREMVHIKQQENQAKAKAGKLNAPEGEQHVPEV